MVVFFGRNPVTKQAQIMPNRVKKSFAVYFWDMKLILQTHFAGIASHSSKTVREGKGSRRVECQPQ
jgi:hypothetical protein